MRAIEMERQTWGLYIPGYSYPSIAQEKKFAKLYPDTVAWHKIEHEKMLREQEHAAELVRKKYRQSR